MISFRDVNLCRRSRNPPRAVLLFGRMAQWGAMSGHSSQNERYNITREHCHSERLACDELGRSRSSGVVEPRK